VTRYPADQDNFKPAPQPIATICFIHPSSLTQFQASAPAQLTVTVRAQAIGIDFQISSQRHNPAQLTAPSSLLLLDPTTQIPISSLRSSPVRRNISAPKTDREQRISSPRRSPAYRNFVIMVVGAAKSFAIFCQFQAHAAAQLTATHHILSFSGWKRNFKPTPQPSSPQRPPLVFQASPPALPTVMVRRRQAVKGREVSSHPPGPARTSSK